MISLLTALDTDRERFRADEITFCQTSGVGDMIARMSLDEKIASMRDASSPIKSLNLPYYDWWK